MSKIILSKQDKTELDYALSTSIGGAVFESILVGFIKEHINKAFVLSNCRCKSALTKAKRLIKKVYKDIMVLDEGDKQCPVCKEIFKAKSKNNIYCSTECRNKNK